MLYNIDTLKAELHETLFLDPDEFGLETAGEALARKFIGLYLRGAFQPIHIEAELTRERFRELALQHRSPTHSSGLRRPASALPGNPTHPLPLRH